MVSEIEIEVDSDANSLSDDMYRNMTNFILGLPAWMDEGQLTLVIFYTNRLKMVNLDKVCRVIAKEKPKLRFKSFELIGPEEGEDKQHSHYSYALNYLIQRSEKISLSNTYIDLRKYKVVNSDCQLKRLSLYQSTFYPAKRNEGELSPLQLTCYNEVSTCISPCRFEDLTQPEELKTLGITSDHIERILQGHGHKLHKLQLLRVDSEPITGLHSLQSLLPRGQMLEELTLNLMKQNTQLTKILNMNYTKFSRTTHIRLVYKLYIDVKLQKQVSPQTQKSRPRLPKTPKFIELSGLSPKKPCTPTRFSHPMSERSSPIQRSRRLSADLVSKDYESDLDSDIDSESFDSDQIVPEYTMEQFETDFHYVKISVSNDAENTKNIVILDK